MKIDWKVRLKNPVFIMTLIPAVISLIYSALAVIGIVPGISENEVVKIMTMIVSFLTTLGVLVDPTTKGLCDGKDENCEVEADTQNKG